jgi:osmoprotectant transport system substrate-binding protein
MNIRQSRLLPIFRCGIFHFGFLLVIVASLVGCTDRRDTIVVGSKNFTEQAILGELIAQHLESQTHLHVQRRFYLSGSYICQQALLAGRIDLYVEYTGTALAAILKEPLPSESSQSGATGSPTSSREIVFDQVREGYAKRFNLEVEPSLGFNNTFAIVVRGEDARAFGLKSLSQLASQAPHWRAGFGYEFMERADGFPGLARTYNLHFAASPRIMDLGLLYRALLDHQVDVVAGNSTDGLLSARDLVILDDDKHYFPPYDAVPVVRPAALQAHPEVCAALAQLSGKISDREMQQMNYAVDGQHQDVTEVAHNFLHSKGLD